MRAKLPASTRLVFRTKSITLPELILGSASIYATQLAIRAATSGEPAIPEVLLPMSTTIMTLCLPVVHAA